MALEQRGNGQYYYRKVWRNSTCVSEYIGSGLIAQLQTIYDSRDRHERTMARLELQDFIQEQMQIDKAIGSYHKAVRQLVAVVLQRAGFHQHKGQWRLRRQEEHSDMSSKQELENRAQLFDEYGRLFKAASFGKKAPADIERLRQFAEANPTVFDNWATFVNTTIEDVIDTMGTNEPTKILIKGETRALQRALGLDTATPMERLLIKDIAVCWLRMNMMEQLYTRSYTTGDGVSFARAAYLENRLSATRRRYHQAIESLARVRGLMVRAGVQINVAQQQVVMNG